MVLSLLGLCFAVLGVGFYGGFALAHRLFKRVTYLEQHSKDIDTRLERLEQSKDQGTLE